jgi:acyl dehydratase
VKTFNDPRALMGLTDEVLGTSDWIVVDQDRIDAFAEATGDHQWIHVDPERAKIGPYGTTIAHGYLTLSLLPALSSTVYQVENAGMTVNYGLDRVRFTGVVPAGSRVRSTIVLVDAQERASGIQLSLEHTLHREGADRPVLVARQLRLLVP